MIQPRPPIVTIMGHVDHGKTSLLDYIRKAHIVDREAGGITQHIGAYQAEFQGKKITFIDTPGHAAFNKMRARGARVTDLVILVVAANDGVKPQTIESIRHIKEAKVPVIVAVNKIDLPNVYPDMAKAQLAEEGILVNGFGGDVDAIELSAKTGQGVDKLLETILVTAELNDYKADPDANLKAIVIESTMDKKRGSVATVIVQQGTLKVRQDIQADEITGRVRQLVDEKGRQLPAITPGSPAEIIGFATPPAVGATVFEQGKPVEATPLSEFDQAASDEAAIAKASMPEIDQFADLFNEQPKLKIVLKADVQGTLEAIQQNLEGDSMELLRAGVGEVTEDDVLFAETTGSLILVFHTKVSKNIEEKAKSAGVKIKKYDVIYKLLEDLQKQMLKLIEPTIDEVVVGEAEIQQIFDMKGEKIAGCKMITGEMTKNSLLHLKRGEEIIANPEVKSLMHGKEQIENVKAKNEFGMTFKQKRLDFQVGDRVIVYKVEED
jgi:translation initiation factor IF-2